MNIAKNVKHFRELAELTQVELAKKANCTSSMITYIEKGEKLPSVALTINIARAIGCTVDELVKD